LIIGSPTEIHTWTNDENLQKICFYSKRQHSISKLSNNMDSTITGSMNAHS
jgi:hypothetical protein